MTRIIIAIDGHSSCGKSSTAKAVAKALNYTYIDSGAMYRAITLYVINNQLINADKELDVEGLIFHLPKINIEIKDTSFFLNGKNVSEDIRMPNISDIVSHVSVVCEVRAKLVGIQQSLGIKGGVVMDGRDIGTVVFPNAELKVFMTALPEVRAKRRFLELKAKGLDISMDAVLSNLLQRDEIDSGREVSPLKQADDAKILDNSHMSFDEQVKLILHWAKEIIERA